MAVRLFRGSRRFQLEVLFDCAAQERHLGLTVRRATAEHWAQHSLRIHDQLKNLIPLSRSTSQKSQVVCRFESNPFQHVQLLIQLRALAHPELFSLRPGLHFIASRPVKVVPKVGHWHNFTSIHYLELYCKRYICAICLSHPSLGIRKFPDESQPVGGSIPFQITFPSHNSSCGQHRKSSA